MMIVVGIGNKTFIQQVSHLYISNSSEVADLINLSDKKNKNANELYFKKFIIELIHIDLLFKVLIINQILFFLHLILFPFC